MFDHADEFVDGRFSFRHSRGYHLAAGDDFSLYPRVWLVGEVGCARGLMVLRFLARRVGGLAVFLDGIQRSSQRSHPPAPGRRSSRAEGVKVTSLAAKGVRVVHCWIRSARASDT